jgi:hypothetical protein
LASRIIRLAKNIVEDVSVTLSPKIYFANVVESGKEQQSLIPILPLLHILKMATTLQSKIYLNRITS